jgi:16S rRNA (guanine527-N7)-methyltransferase
VERAALEIIVGLLERARDRGFLGPGPVREHIRHAEAFAAAAGPPAELFADLGSGAGVPGLVLAVLWPGARGLLLDAGERRTAHLEEAVLELDVGERMSVVRGRAEAVARDPAWRERADLVVSRSFGRPAVTAECAVGLLRPGGRLVVSEPPVADTAARWPTGPLADLGFGVAVPVEAGAAHFVRLERTADGSNRWPRRTGVPGKRPLW